MTKTSASSITQPVISDPVTWMATNLFAIPWAALFSKVFDLLHPEARQLAAAKAASTDSIQGVAALSRKARWNRQAVLPHKQKGELHLADGVQLSTPVIRRQFLDELLRDCGFFAHLVFRQVRAASKPSSRFLDPDSSQTKLNVVKVSQTPPRSRSNVLPRHLPAEASDLHPLWVEVGYRHVQTHLPEKECHDYGENPKPAL